MKEKWKVIASMVKGDFGLEVQPSYEGWGAGYDPKNLPLLEMWARGEVKDIPQHVKKPKGIVFSIPELIKKHEDIAINHIRHEVNYLLSTNLYFWRLGQREFFKFGIQPTAFLVLYSVLESIKADELIIRKHPKSSDSLKDRYNQIIKELPKKLYPHHRLALGFLMLWLGRLDEMEPEVQRKVKSLEGSFFDYLSSDEEGAYYILMEDLFGKYRVTIEESQELSHIDMLVEEAWGKAKEGHRARIITDVLGKLPQDVRALIKSQMSLEEKNHVLGSLKNIPDWMQSYMREMSYINLVEKDLAYISHFLPKTLERDIEHRGFVSFLLKGWEGVGEGGFSNSSNKKEELSERDKKYERLYKLKEKDFREYRLLLKSVLPHVESMKRRFTKLFQQEDEGWTWGYVHGRRMDHRRISVEVPTKQGRIYKRRILPDRKRIAFKLLIDVSSSMKREEKIHNALRSLILFSEVLEKMDLPFSIDAFNSGMFSIKPFATDYSSSLSRIIELSDILGGTTNIEEALIFASEDLETFCKRNGIKGILILFSDGEPTRGLKGKPLKGLIDELKAKFPIVGIGVGSARNFIEDYFGETAIRVTDMSKLPSAFTFVMENQFRRLQTQA